MANQPFVFCNGPHAGPCPNRFIRLLGEIAEKGVTYPRGCSAADVFRHIVKLGRGRQDVRCEAAAGHFCPFKPSYNEKTCELSVCGVVVRQFRSPCRQTDLLQVFESRCWPECIMDPLGDPSEVDAENGLGDLLYQLNQIHNNDSPQQVHFWQEPHHGMHWEIVATPRVSR